MSTIRRAFVTKALFAGAAAVMVSGSGAAHAQIVSGQIVGVDFGPTAPSNDYNQVAGLDGTYGPFTDLNAATTGVGLVVAGGTQFSNDDGTSQDLANYPASLELADANTTDFIGEFSDNKTFTLTFTGLNNALTYNVFGVSAFDGRNLGVTFSAGAQSALTDSTSTSGGTLAQLTGLSTDGNGNLVVNVSSGDVAVVNAIAIQAVPEPTSVAVLGLGGLGLLARRRRLV